MGLGPSSLTPEETVYLANQLDLRCAAVADAVRTADVFLLCTGAGFSADSGLAVYRDIADIDAYRRMDVDYHDLCNPRWLHRDPELFYGFWGSCYNDYRETEPHPGYGIIRRWRDQRFARSPVAQEVRHGQSKFGAATAPEAAFAPAPYKVSGVPGAFFCFTSNVDAHSYDVFDPHEVRECHGNTELWQCGHPAGPCCSRAWRAPLDFRFSVDAASMRVAADRGALGVGDGSRSTHEGSIEEDGAGVAAGGERAHAAGAAEAPAQQAAPAEATGSASEGSAVGEAGAGAAGEPGAAAQDCGAGAPIQAAPTEAPGSAGEGATAEDAGAGAAGEPEAAAQEAAPRVGRVRRPYGPRKAPLGMLPVVDPNVAPGFVLDGTPLLWPVCLNCGGRARPAVLMFGDSQWVDVDEQERRWDRWVSAVENLIARRSAGLADPLRIVILEIGCGGNVTTVRRVSEETAGQFAQSGAMVTLARVNPDLPKADQEASVRDYRHISVLARGLDAIQRIDAAMSQEDVVDAVAGSDGAEGCPSDSMVISSSGAITEPQAASPSGSRSRSRSTEKSAPLVAHGSDAAQCISAGLVQEGACVVAGPGSADECLGRRLLTGSDGCATDQQAASPRRARSRSCSPGKPAPPLAHGPEATQCAELGTSREAECAVAGPESLGIGENGSAAEQQRAPGRCSRSRSRSPGESASLLCRVASARAQGNDAEDVSTGMHRQSGRSALKVGILLEAAEHALQKAAPTPAKSASRLGHGVVAIQSVGASLSERAAGAAPRPEESNGRPVESIGIRRANSVVGQPSAGSPSAGSDPAPRQAASPTRPRSRSPFPRKPAPSVGRGGDIAEEVDTGVRQNAAGAVAGPEDAEGCPGLSTSFSLNGFVADPPADSLRPAPSGSCPPCEPALPLRCSAEGPPEDHEEAAARLPAGVRRRRRPWDGPRRGTARSTNSRMRPRELATSEHAR